MFCNHFVELLPADFPLLTSATEAFTPESHCVQSEVCQSFAVTGHTVIVEVADKAQVQQSHLIFDFPVHDFLHFHFERGFRPPKT